jgi:hypothetical protein
VCAAQQCWSQPIVPIQICGTANSGSENDRDAKKNKAHPRGQIRRGKPPVELIEDDTAWSPYLSPEDVRKLDTVRLALKRGDIAEAAKHGRVFELTPVAAK